MGDRGNIVVRQEATNRGDVWFYTHWSGGGIGETVKTALARKQRWDDPSYLARIIFDTLTNGDKGETGFGISTTIQDNSRDIVVVDIPQQMVFTVEESECKDGRAPDGLTDGVPFAEYIKD